MACDGGREGDRGGGKREEKERKRGRGAQKRERGRLFSRRRQLRLLGQQTLPCECSHNRARVPWGRRRSAICPKVTKL
jgi:hypothetical protein